MSKFFGSVPEFFQQLLSPPITNQTVICDAMSSSQHLQTLVLQALYDPLPVGILKSVSLNTSLTSLDISYSPMSLFDTAFIAKRLALQSASPLVKLHVNDLSLPSEAFDLILESLSQQNCVQDLSLRRLNFSTPSTSAATGQWSRYLALCTTLTRLNVESRQWVYHGAPNHEHSLSCLAAAVGCLTALKSFSYCQECDDSLNKGQDVVLKALSNLWKLSELSIFIAKPSSMNKSSVAVISSYLKSCSQLRELSLGTISSSCAEEVTILCSGLSSTNAQLKRLHFDMYGLSMESCLILASVFPTLSFLEEISFVGSNSLSPLIMEPIAHTLKASPFSGNWPRKVRLRAADVSAKCLEALADLVQDQTRPHEFLFSAYFLHLEFLLTFFDRLGAAPGLVRLDFHLHHMNKICSRVCNLISSSNHIKRLLVECPYDYPSEPTTIAIADAIASNTSLVDVTVRLFMQSSLSCVVLAEMLKRNPTLTKLCLRSPGDAHEDAIEILMALRVNTTLLQLQLPQVETRKYSQRDAAEFAALSSGDAGLARGISFLPD